MFHRPTLLSFVSLPVRRDDAATGDAFEEVLRQQFGHRRYVTGILADLDLATGRLSWVNRGHLPPVVIRGGRRVTALRCAPPGLWAPASSCERGCVEQREPGGRLLLFTDGITEAREASCSAQSALPISLSATGEAESAPVRLAFPPIHRTRPRISQLDAQAAQHSLDRRIQPRWV